MVLLLGVEQHVAQGVSLGVIAPTALVGTIIHCRRESVSLKTVLWIAPMAVIFALIGGWLADMIETSMLSQLFGILLLIIGVRLLLGNDFLPRGKGKCQH
jgi:hypothetical protein